MKINGSISSLAEAWERFSENPQRLQIIGTIGTLVVILLFFGPHQGGDWGRFENQALSLLAGEGFNTWGKPEALLPPGYPILVAIVYWLGGNVTTLVVLQIFLIIAAANLVFLTLLPVSHRLAFFAMLGLGLNPWVARMASTTFSESLGIFLCAAFIWFFSSIIRGRHKWALLAGFGFTSLMLPLTSPATVVMTAILWLVVVFRIKSSVPGLLAMFLGTMIVFVPWEFHCTSASGKFCTTLYASNGATRDDDLVLWFRTWAKSESEIDFALHVGQRRENFLLTPDHAFDSEEQREYLTDALMNEEKFEAYAKNGLAGPKKFPEFEEIALERIQKQPFKFYFLLPAIRSFGLWLEMDQFMHAQMSYVGRLWPGSFLRDSRELGTERAVMRYAKAVVSTALYPMYLSYALMLTIAAFCGAVRREWIPILIIISIIIYTIISGYYALGEPKRNLVFYPAILYLLFWIYQCSGKASQE